MSVLPNALQPVIVDPCPWQRFQNTMMLQPLDRRYPEMHVGQARFLRREADRLCAVYVLSDVHCGHS